MAHRTGPNRPTQRAHAYSLLRSILGTAVSEQILASNPCVIRAAGVARRRSKTEPATIDELRVIRENMPDRLRLAVDLAAWCGLRQGEILELRRGDVDASNGVVRIRRAVTRVPASRHSSAPPRRPQECETSAFRRMSSPQWSIT